ncbi:MAG: response regulator [Caulobacteraceae bacterium]
MPGAELNLDKDERINLEQATVLLLEAPRPSNDILAQTLYGFGVRQPIRCHQVEQALERARADVRLDLIICDADADGQSYDFVRRLRSDAPEPNRFCPVILLSGHTAITQVTQARDCGANFVVAKPLKALVLLERIFWVSSEKRIFVELPGYAGPDRRFQSWGPPPGEEGRRSGDGGEVGEAHTPNLTQEEIDRFLRTPPRATS